MCACASVGACVRACVRACAREKVLKCIQCQLSTHTCKHALVNQSANNLDQT